MRYAMLVAAALALAGCADDVSVQNPKTGERLVCRQDHSGLDPWSQTQACVAGHLAQGWTLDQATDDSVKAR